MFHAVPGMMEAGKAYDTAAGPDAGQLVVNEAGDTVTGPCNSANVSMTVDVCGSVAHVIDAVLLPASFCADSAQTEVGEDEDEDEHDGDHDHDHDHDGEDHDDDKDGDLESEDVEDDVEELRGRRRRGREHRRRGRWVLRGGPLSARRAPPPPPLPLSTRGLGVPFVFTD